MSEFISRIAASIVNILERRYPNYQNSHTHVSSNVVVRNVVAEMREATPEMLNEGSQVLQGYGLSEEASQLAVRDVWLGMIEEAL